MIILNKRKLKISKVKISIIFTIILGTIIGVVSTSTLKDINYQVTRIDKSYLSVFLNSFSLNYWYFFIIWIFGMIPLGFCVIYFIIFFKSFILGITLGICLKSMALLGVVEFLSFVIVDVLILIPTLIYISNASINYSMIFNNNLNKNPGQYFNRLIKVTILIIIYAILSSLKMTFLEV